MKKPKIVVLGAGYGGILTVQNLQRKLGVDEAEIILVNKNDYHYLTTELHQPAAGTFPYEKTKVELNEIIDFNRVNFVQDVVENINTSEQKVTLRNEVLDYDYLVVGLGAEPETFGTPGIHEYAFSKWTIDDVLKLNLHIESKFEKFNETKNVEDLTFVVAGGGFTGIEFISELAYAVPKLCEKHKVDRSLVRLILVDPGENILTGFDPELVKLATAYLENNGVELFNGTGVAECNQYGVKLKNDTIINANTVVWAAGVRGNSVVDNSGIESMRGRVKVDPYLRAPGFENVFVIGDCSLFINKETDRPYPPTAQISMQMGANLAHNLVSILHKNDSLRPFVPSIKGTVASLGKKYAVGVVLGKKIKGFTAVTMKKIIDLRYLFIIGGLSLVFRKGRF